MKSHATWIFRTVTFALAISAIGCGQGFKSGQTGSLTSAASVNVNDQIAQASKATKEAQDAMALAQDAINQISDANGNINMGLFTKASSSKVQATGLLAPLIAKLQPLFDDVYNKVVVVKQKYDAARLSLADALSKLNANDPAQAQLIAQIQDQMAKVDALENSFRDSVHTLGGKLTLAITGIDKIVSGVTSFIPGFGWLASLAIDYLVMDDVKNLILDLQVKLMAL